MNKRFTKYFNIDIKSVDEENRQVVFCFSDDQEDRQGEIVDQASWDIKNYMANPVILWGHDPSKPEYVLGQGVAIDLNNNGRSYITAQFDDDATNPTAGMVFRQIVRRTLRTVSAGFITHTYEYADDIPVLKDNELLEISIAPIPANPRALAKELKAGNITTKDAKWLVESMAAESKALTELIEANPNSKKEKSMTPEQATAIIDGMAALTTEVAALKTENEALRTDVAELKPPVETEEEKTAREAKEAEDKAAAEKAEADKMAAEEEAARVAAEEEEAKKNPAKSGDDDQDGAGDELDDDTELTPELQAKIDAELELAVAN